MKLVLNMNDVFAYALPLSGAAKACVVMKNGDFIILVNSNLCQETQEKAFSHELEHINHDHFYDYRYVGVLEKEACKT